MFILSSSLSIVAVSLQLKPLFFAPKKCMDFDNGKFVTEFRHMNSRHTHTLCWDAAGAIMHAIDAVHKSTTQKREQKNPAN